MSPRCSTTNTCLYGDRGTTSTNTFLFLTQSQSNVIEPPGFITFNQEIAKNGTDIVASIPTSTVILQEDKAYYIAYSSSGRNETNAGIEQLQIQLFADGIAIGETLVGQTVLEGDIYDIAGAIIIEARSTINLQVRVNTTRTNLRSNLVIIELASLTPLVP